MKQLGERIRTFRTLRNMTQDDLANAMGESSGRVIYTWEKGTAKPDCLKLVKLSEILNVSVDELLGCKIMVNRPSEAEWTSILKYRSLDERGKKVVDTVLDTEYEISCEAQNKKKKRMIKLDYYTMPASAGTGIFLDSEEAEELYVPECAEAEEADFVLSVSGDSMEPTFHDGDKIFVCKQDAIDIGEIGIFIINGDAYVKELGAGKLISHNEKYRPIPFKSDDSIYCCGRVLGVVEGVK